MIIKRRLQLRWQPVEDITYTIESDIKDTTGKYRTFEIAESDTVDYLWLHKVPPRSG